MICPNCGRRNSAGATFCSRCHQRLPLASRIDTNRRRAAIVEPRGGGGSGAVVLAVALLAGMLFIAGAAAIYLSNPPGAANPTNVAVGSGSPTLPPFVQQTASPAPTPSPTFILLPSESPSFSPLPTGTFVVGPTSPPTPVGPTNPPRTPGPTQPPRTPGPTQPPTQAVKLRYACGQIGTSRQIGCSDNSTGPIASREWTFGDGSPPVSQRQPVHEYLEYGTYTVTLVLHGTDGQQYRREKSFTIKPEPTPGPTNTPTQEPTEPPQPTDQPSQAPESAAPSNGPASEGTSAP